jgi:hypothetical protein
LLLGVIRDEDVLGRLSVYNLKKKRISSMEKLNNPSQPELSNSPSKRTRSEFFFEISREGVAILLWSIAFTQIFIFDVYGYFAKKNDVFELVLRYRLLVVFGMIAVCILLLRRKLFIRDLCMKAEIRTVSAKVKCLKNRMTHF